MNNIFTLSGRTAIVTGGTKGIGRSSQKGYQRRAFSVVLLEEMRKEQMLL